MSERADTGDVYLRTKAAFVATVAPLGPDGLGRAVPATPGWTVREVLAHVVGLAAARNAQRFPAPGDEGAVAWNAGLVDERRGRTVAELVDEWDREAPRFAEGLRLFGYGFGSHFVGDLHAHHQDVRHALGLPRDDDPVTVAVALDHYLGFLGERLAERGWGKVTAVADGEFLQVGAGPHRAPRWGHRGSSCCVRCRLVGPSTRSGPCAGRVTASSSWRCSPGCTPAATRSRRWASTSDRCAGPPPQVP